MFKNVFDLIQQLLLLAHDTQENKTRLRELQDEVEDLTLVVSRLVLEVQRLQENEAHEREKIALRLENQLLRFERRLPSGPPEGERPEEQ